MSEHSALYRCTQSAYPSSQLPSASQVERHEAKGLPWQTESAWQASSQTAALLQALAATRSIAERPPRARAASAGDLFTIPMKTRLWSTPCSSADRGGAPRDGSTLDAEDLTQLGDDLD